VQKVERGRAFKEHRNSLKKGDTTISKLVEHALNEDHLFEWDRATVLVRETKWKARKFHEAALIYMGGEQVVVAPSMDIDPIIWQAVLDEYNKIVEPLSVVNPSVSLRRSARLKNMQVTRGAPPLHRLLTRQSSRQYHQAPT
jgi:hypothetical protein